MALDYIGSVITWHIMHLQSEWTANTTISPIYRQSMLGCRLLKLKYLLFCSAEQVSSWPSCRNWIGVDGIVGSCHTCIVTCWYLSAFSIKLVRLSWNFSKRWCWILEVLSVWLCHNAVQQSETTYAKLLIGVILSEVKGGLTSERNYINVEFLSL